MSTDLKIYGAIGLGVILVTAAVFILEKNVSISKVPIDAPVPPIENTPITPVVLNEREIGVKEGGIKYTDPTNTYSFLYPSDYKVSSENEGQHIRLLKIGATQKGQTEMYDGVLIVFELVELKDGQTLEQFVDVKIADSIKDGTVSIVEPKKDSRINKYSGFEYTANGLGEHKTIIVNKDKTSQTAVVISMLIADPKNVGFQQEADAILSTLELLK